METNSDSVLHSSTGIDTHTQLIKPPIGYTVHYLTDVLPPVRERKCQPWELLCLTRAIFNPSLETRAQHPQHHYKLGWFSQHQHLNNIVGRQPLHSVPWTRQTKNMRRLAGSPTTHGSTGKTWWGVESPMVFRQPRKTRHTNTSSREYPKVTTVNRESRNEDLMVSLRRQNGQADWNNSWTKSKNVTAVLSVQRKPMPLSICSRQWSDFRTTYR
jgi:hypothetical protein